MSSSSSEPQEQFAEALRAAGLLVQGPPVMDGQLHRVPVEGDHGKDRSGAYKGYLDGRPAGFVQNFRTGTKANWKATGQVTSATVEDRAALASLAAQRLQDRAREREGVYERTAGVASALWAAAAPASAHPYLTAKCVAAHGLREDGRGNLLVPLQDVHGTLWSLQRIGPDGSKQFKADGRVDGGHYMIGDVHRVGPLLVAEGFATAATVHELTGHPVVTAFNAGNLGKVAQAYRERFPGRAIYIAGDNDHRREAEGKPNVGRVKAEEAAAAIDGHALIPSFAPGAAGSDWNDVARLEGREAAQLALVAGIRIAEREQMVAGMGAARLSERSLERDPVKARERADAELER